MLGSDKIIKSKVTHFLSAEQKVICCVSLNVKQYKFKEIFLTSKTVCLKISCTTIGTPQGYLPTSSKF